MPVRTHTRPHPTTAYGTGARLPWWALALPALAFVALLLLLRNPSGAHAAGGDPAITHLVERIRTVLAH